MVVFPKGDHHIGEKVMVKIVGSTSATLLGTTDFTDERIS
jgi:tRNA-2-methylthio-N6-dimethylallyladenosine synthase